MKSTRGERRVTKKSEAEIQETNEQNEERNELKYARRALALPEGVKVSELISFTWYYAKLRLRVLSGQHHTSHSLAIKYRWHNWQHWQRSKRS